MKISDYLSNLSPDIENDFFVTAYNGQNYKARAGNIQKYKPNLAYFEELSEEFLYDATFGLTGNFNCTGLLNVLSDVNHPGISTYNPSPLTILTSNIANHLLVGGEAFEAIFKINVSTALVMVNGYATTTNPATAVGAWMNISGTTLTGKTGNVGISTTPSSYTLSLATWYRMKVSVNLTATQVDFFLYDENGALLWSASLTTNIPTVTPTRLQVYISGDVAAAYLDLITFYSTKELIR